MDNPTDKPTPIVTKARRGFAAMDPQKQRAIASLGGQAAHRCGNAHQFTTEEARAAGIKRHQKPGATDMQTPAA